MRRRSEKSKDIHSLTGHRYDQATTNKQTNKILIVFSFLFKNKKKKLFLLLLVTLLRMEFISTRRRNALERYLRSPCVTGICNGLREEPNFSCSLLRLTLMEQLVPFFFASFFFFFDLFLFNSGTETKLKRGLVLFPFSYLKSGLVYVVISVVLFHAPTDPSQRSAVAVAEARPEMALTRQVFVYPPPPTLPLVWLCL